jgi:hypothetical protein
MSQEYLALADAELRMAARLIFDPSAPEQQPPTAIK